MSPEHVVVVPSTLLLLQEYAGLEDPAQELREGVRRAVRWLVARHPHEICVLAAEPRPDNVARGVASSPGDRLGRHVLGEAGFAGRHVDRAAGLLVVANGTARRSERAPGHLDERAADYDLTVEKALRSGSAAELRDLDTGLGAELWAHDAPVLRELGSRVAGDVAAEVEYAGDPYGVQYWVVRWTCAS